MHSLTKYGLVFRLAAQELFEYRFDFFANTTKYTLMILLMATVWVNAGNEASLPLSSQETVRYYFFSAILFSLSNFHTTYIEDDIRLGLLNKFLLKPISAFGYYFTYEAASASIQTLLKCLVMVPLLWVAGFGFKIEPGRLLLAIAFFPVIYSFTFTFYSLMSGLSFWITEAFALRWATTILLRFFAGSLLPISFLPGMAQKIMYWLPFQHLTYTPIQILQNKMSISQALGALTILFGWTLVVQVLRIYQWRFGYRQFESSGI